MPKKKHGRGGSQHKRHNRGAPSTPRSAPQLPSIQEQLQSVSLLWRVSAAPGAPRLCSCMRSNWLKPCAPFGSFCTIPVDVTLLLLSHLPAQTLLGKIALLNTKWRSLSASAELWQLLCLARWSQLGALQQEGIRNWLVVYGLWHSGAARNMLRLLKFCPLKVAPPDRAELVRWYSWWAVHRKLNTCPFGGVELFRRMPLSNVQTYQPNTVIDDAFERCREELLREYRCPIYTHELFIAVTQAELRQLERHGWGVINPRLTCRPEGGAPDDGRSDMVGGGQSAESWLDDFRERLEIKCSGKYDPSASELVANTDTPGVYAFWYNAGRAVLYREDDANFLLSLSVLVPQCLPHSKVISRENAALSYSMSPLNRESIKPKWVAEIGTAYESRELGWALLEARDAVVPPVA